MADNFLEKRMDDLRRGKLSSAVGKRHPLPLKGRFFFVPDGATPGRRGVVEQLRRDGATVVFSGFDMDVAVSLEKVYGAISLKSLIEIHLEPGELSADIEADPTTFIRNLFGKDAETV